MKKDEIVKYYNSFNKIQLPNFNELELNLLFAIIANIKEKKGQIVFTSKDLMKLLNLSYRPNRKEIDSLVESLKIKFFKADFSILKEEVEIRNGKKIELITKEYFNLFRKFALSWEKDTNLVSKIELVVNEDFAYLIYDLVKNFTTFELKEFIAVNGKYTKLLYRLLKQYRTQGKAPIEPMPIDEFRRILDIPEKYRQIDIDDRILKPAIKELSERTILEPNRVAFKNLKYQKIKGSGRGRGGNVEAIQFTFTPEKTKNDDNTIDVVVNSKKQISSDEKQNNTINTNESHLIMQFMENLNKTYKYKEVIYNDKKEKCINFEFDPLNKNIILFFESGLTLRVKNIIELVSIFKFLL